MHLRQVEWYVSIIISFTGLLKISAKPTSLNRDFGFGQVNLKDKYHFVPLEIFTILD